MVPEAFSWDEIEPQWKIKIPKKIGGTVGEVIGTVTNPIKDNITAPIGEAFNEAIFNQVVEITDRLAKDNHGQDFDDCVPIVAAAAAAYGASVGGPLGAAIGAGAGVPAARITCRKIFP